MITKKLDQIGEGANSKIYLCEFKQGNFNDTVAMKQFNWNTKYKVEKTLEVYSKLRRAGIPTLEFCLASRFEDQDCLVLENINPNPDYKYVSYNTIVNGKPSDAETIRTNYKLDKILDFPFFLEKTKQEIRNYTFENICLYFDTYFFGSNISNVSELKYKIVDLDNIEFFETYSPDNFDTNMAQFKDAITGFVKYFVNTNSQPEYLKLISLM